MDREQVTFRDLVDLKELKLLFAQFSAATGFTVGLVEQSTNEVLLSAGWHDICVQFHRACPDSREHCIASNKTLSSGLTHAGKVRIRHCANGLVDGCTPIFIEGKHYANLFSGQILFTPPDIEKFRKQARQYGYDEQAYLESLARVPVVNEERFTAMLHYLAHTAAIIADTGLLNLRARHEASRREALLQSIFTSSPVGIGFTVNRVLQWTNKRMAELTGYSSVELEGQSSRILYPSEEEYERVGREKYLQIQKDGTGSVDTQFRRKDGSIVDVHLSSTPIDQRDLSLGVTFTVLDITERNLALAAIQEKEERLEMALQGADLGMWDWNIQSNEVYFSPRYFSMLGYEATELPQTLETWENLLHPEERGWVKKQILAVIGKGSTVWNQEFRMRAKDGNYIWILGRGKIVEFAGDGSPLRAAGTHLDISRHKIAIEKLRDREERFRELFNNISSGVAVYTAVENGRDFIFEDINPAGVLSSKVARPELIGRKVSEIFPAIKSVGLLDVFQRVWQTGVPEHYPVTAYQDERIRQWVENYVCKTSSGELIAIYEDVTEQKEAETKLLRAKTEWERTFDAMPDIVTIQDTGFAIIRANKAACNTLGLDCDEIVGQHCFELFNGAQEPCQHCPLLETKETFVPYSREMYHKKLGKTFLVSAAPVLDKQGKLEFIAHVAKDISALKESEEERVRLVAAIDQASEAVVMTDRGGNIQYVNPAFEKLTGYSREEVKNKNPRILKSGRHTPAFYKKMWTMLLQGHTWRGHLINRKKNGSLFEEEATISPVKNREGEIINFVAVKRDVSREVSLEKQLRQAMKMEAIGTLAGGIAHDFNNILAAILGYSEIAQEQLSVNDPIRKDLEQVIIAGDRAAELVRQILTFSRQEEQDLQPLQIHVIVKEALKLLRSSLPATIRLKVDIDSNCGLVMADPTEIHQVLMNLCTNAKHAIAGENGVLSVSLSEVKVSDSESIEECPQIAHGTYIDLEISDTGYGMDGLTRSKIFDPFFTTKERGEGTGLGLAVVHGIIKRHKGEVTVSSEPGQGTTFHVYLPVIEGEGRVVERSVVKEGQGGNERILLVDDESVIANILERMLRNIGYSVTVFTSSRDAFACYQKNPDAFDLVLTDMTMPDMTGAELTRKLLALRPDLPIVLCTGFSEAIDESKALSLGVRQYVMKPVDKHTLAQAVRRALSGP